MKGVDYRTDWLEIGAGPLLLAFAASLRLLDARLFSADLITMAALFGLSAAFIAHVLRPWRGAYLANMVFIAFIYAMIVVWSAAVQNMALLIFHTVYGVVLTAALMRSRRPRRDAERKDAGGRKRKALLLVAGPFLFLYGIALAAEVSIPGWFRNDAFLPAEGLIYLVKSLLTAFIGAAVIMSVHRRWEGWRRHVTMFASVGALGIFSASHFAANAFVSGAVLGSFALMVFASVYWDFMHVVPPGLERASDRVREVYSYELIGKIGFWVLLALGAIYFVLIETADPHLYFLAVAVAVVVGVVSWHIIPARLYGQRQYLITIFGLIASFTILLASGGGIESPFVFFAFVLVFSGNVVISSRSAVIPVLVLLAVLSLDLFAEYLALGAVSRERVIQFVFISTALAATGLYTVMVARRREQKEEALGDLNQRLERSIRDLADERQQHIEEAERIKQANDELVEMRSALMNVLEDVEESKQQLEAEHLRESAIFEALGEGLVAADENGEIIRFNPMAEDVTGISKQDAIGKPVETVLKFYRSGENFLYTEAMRKAFKGEGGALDDDLEIQNSDGLRIPVAGTVRPFYGTEDQLVGIVIAFRDVTMEREIDEQKSGFISVASHQLRTPLSAMRWYVDLLLEGDAGKLTAQQSEFLNDVHSSIRRMADLVDDLLNVSRAEEGRLELRPEPVPPGTFFGGIVKDLRPAAEEKRQNVVTDIPGDLPDIHIDERYVRQVFENLLTNAIKYTPEGGEVGITASEKENGLVLVEIWDTGYGIPKEQQHHIFEKFYRGERAISMETVGTGLGLYIAKNIIESSGGEIWFESAEGEGTHFYVSVPADAPQDET